MPTATGRKIIKTKTAGWFIDPATGKKTRKQDGDQVVTQAEYDRIKGGKPAASKSKVKLTTGKTTQGETLVRKDAWVDPEKRTPKQQKLFDSGFKNVPAAKTYEKVVAAAEGKRSAMPSGAERVIKPQDAFQVRFSPENQTKWRAELRRKKNRERRQAARKAAKA